jgi:DNA-binding NarL/FixJ family response regulator
MQAMLNKKDKEELVIQLYQEGKPMREIAQRVHLSFGSIGKIIRRLNGLDNSETLSSNMSNKSKETQALFLFAQGKRPIDVAVELDLSSSEVENILQEYWVLNHSSRHHNLAELRLLY